MLSLKVTSNDSGTLPIMFLCWTQFCLQYLVASLQVWFRGHQSLSIWDLLCVSFKSWNKNSFHSFTSIPSIAMVDGVVQSDILASIRHNIVLRLLLRRLEIMRRLYVLFCFFSTLHEKLATFEGHQEIPRCLLFDLSSFVRWRRSFLAISSRRLSSMVGNFSRTASRHYSKSRATR